MRVYALLLGILLTTGYGYAAQIAVSSLGAGRQPATEPAAVVPATNSLDGVWYGGVLDPVTVESRSGGARHTRPGSAPFPERSRGAPLRPAPSPARNPISPTAVGPASMEPIRWREGP